MLPRVRLIVVALMALAWAHVGHGAAISDDRIAALYRPLQAELVALSPDGAHIAYTRHERGELSILIMAVDRPEKKFKIAIENDRPVEFSRERAPARLRLLRWISPRRLLFASTPYHNGTNLVAAIHAINLDGTDAKTLVGQRDFDLLQSSSGEGLPIVITRPTNILGFLDRERRQLLVEAMGRLTSPPMLPVPTGLFSLDVGTGKLKSLTENDGYGRYFYDRTGRARLFYEHPRTAETRTFFYQTGGTWGRWTAFDESHFGPVAKSFVITLKNYYGERAFPLGFDANPNIVYFASNVGRDTYGVYGFDLEKKQRTDFAVEMPHVDLVPALEPGDAGHALIFDEARGQVVGVRATGVTAFSHWTDAELAQTEHDVQRKFPGRVIELLQWDDARARFLVRAGALGEPGRYYVFQKTENLLVEVLNRGPWLPRTELNEATIFEFDTADGQHLSGYLTLPRRPRLKPSPLLIDFSHGWTNRAFPGFDREAQVLADMGFVVARVNHRGGSGFGAQHRLAIHGGIDRVPVEDAVAAIEWIARHHAIDRRRVATIGRGLGGYLALRALQLRPDVFRCGIAIDAPLDPQNWLMPPMPPVAGPSPDRAPVMTMGAIPSIPPPPINFRREALRNFVERGNQRGISVLRNVDQLTRPVMLIVDAPRDRLVAAQNSELRGALKRRDRVADYVEVGTGVTADLPGARAKLYRQIEGFFNLNLYDFDVKVGPLKEVK